MAGRPEHRGPPDLVRIIYPFQGRHRFNTSGGAILENYSLHGAARPEVNTRSLDGSRKSGGAMPSNGKSGGAKAPPSVPPLRFVHVQWRRSSKSRVFTLYSSTGKVKQESTPRSEYVVYIIVICFAHNKPYYNYNSY